MSDATGSCYHTSSDDPSIVDMGKLAAQSEIAFRLMVELSEASVSPPWVSTLPLTVTFPDAVIMLEVLDRSIGALPLFPPATQNLILSGRASVQAIVDAGPTALGVDDGNTVGWVALQLLGAVRNLPCDFGKWCSTVEVLIVFEGEDAIKKCLEFIGVVDQLLEEESSIPLDENVAEIEDDRDVARHESKRYQRSRIAPAPVEATPTTAAS